jgi:hypothetical protein
LKGEWPVTKSPITNLQSSLLSRFGFAATAVLYVVVGATTARLALAGAQDPAMGLGGGLAWLLRHPHGTVVLAAVAAGFLSFAVWHLLEARARRAGAFERIGHAFGAAGYLGLAATAVSVFLHRRAPEGAFIGLERWISRLSLGPLLLQASGLATMAGGLFEVWQGATGRLRQRFATRWLPSDAARLVRRIARFGIASRGVVLIVIGVLQIRVARGLEAVRSPDVGRALTALARSNWGGPWLAIVVALGLVAYGVYMGALALALRRR